MVNTGNNSLLDKLSKAAKRCDLPQRLLVGRLHDLYKELELLEGKFSTTSTIAEATLHSSVAAACETACGDLCIALDKLRLSLQQLEKQDV